MAAKRYPFLSDEWVEEARRVRAEHRASAPPFPISVRMNQIINEVPFGDGVLHAHLDTSSGELELETGHLDHPDLTITVDYRTAKAILVEGDVDSALQAFFKGVITVDGDITKLLALQGSGLGAADEAAAHSASAAALARALQDITE